MEIKKLQSTVKIPKFKRVCAYARVSSGKESMLHSLASQVSYYSSYIQTHRDWLYCGVFSDEDFTGTKNDRPGFQTMLEKAKNHEIDIILTKSISRFARNTVDLINTIRSLRDLNVDVWFEQEHIQSMSSQGDLLLTLLASSAQEESRANSERMKWRVKRCFENGNSYSGTMLGYRLCDGKLVVEPNEAEIIRKCYELYLEGKGYTAIAKILNSLKFKTRYNRNFNAVGVKEILLNITYTGDLLLQKKYRENHLTKKVKINNGILPQYYVEESHQPIISKDLFNKVQIEIKKRSAEHPNSAKRGKYELSGLLLCGCCNRHFVRSNSRVHPSWRCTNYAIYGTDVCKTHPVDEEEILGIIQYFKEQNLIVKQIIVNEDSLLTFKLENGTEINKTVKGYSRKKSWTPEMKEKARERARLQRRTKICQK